MRSAGSVKSSASRPKPGMLAVQPQSAGLEVQQLDLQRVAGLGALDRDRPVDLVDPAEVEVGEVGDGRVPR